MNPSNISAESPTVSSQTAKRSDARWFRPDPPSVRAAREFVRTCVTEAEMTDCLEDAQLVVSELATNAVRHARRAFCVRVEIEPLGADTWIRLEVRDADPSPPVLRHAPPEADSGRGLSIVNQCVDHWGHHGLERGGKIVFATFRASAGHERPSGSGDSGFLSCDNHHHGNGGVLT